MRHIIYIASMMIFISISLTGMAMPITPQSQIELNTITYRVSDADWTSSDTAKVTVAIDASLQQAKLDHIHQDITHKLTTLAKQVDWHITTFQRVKNESGLEQVHAEASARLPLANIGGIRQQAKKVSSPGETFRVQSIDYSPSKKNIEKVRGNLRQQLYQQVKAELARLNGVYPSQHYYVHRIEFTPLYPSTSPRPQRMMATATADNDASTQSGMQMSQRITADAIVTLASTPAKQ